MSPLKAKEFCGTPLVKNPPLNFVSKMGTPPSNLAYQNFVLVVSDGRIEALIQLNKLHLITTDIGTREGQGKGHETMGIENK